MIYKPQDAIQNGVKNKCGFGLDDKCYCDDMECYGLKCAYPDMIDCPIHLEPDYMDNKMEMQLMTEKYLREELKIRNMQLDLYKKEVQKLRGVIELQDKLIERLEDCMGNCDPFLCDRVKEELIYED